MTLNKYQQLFIDGFVKVFRRYNTSCLHIIINGIATFIKDASVLVALLLEQLKSYDIHIELCGGLDSVKSFDIECHDDSDGSSFHTHYKIQSISSLVELSSKTDIPIVCLIIMKAVAIVICKYKVLYKAVALDLDDTLWMGTLSEIGVEQIKTNLLTKEGAPFISFMRFILILAQELGIFIAICSRNDSESVTTAIEALDESIFPIKNQIDCIVANNNNKSDNLLLIAKQLSILPDSIIFIDDNEMVREEVKAALPGICVPDWENHEELTTALIAGCFFDRNELSLKTKNRRKQYRIIIAERNKTTRPALPIAIVNDLNHRNAIELYTKSNQFNFSQRNNCFDQCAESIYFELFRDSGESLGVCSVITFIALPEHLNIINWAMSCRFFEIGVEEAILLSIYQRAGNRNVSIQFNDSGLNQKAKGIIAMYPELFVRTEQSGVIKLLFSQKNVEVLNKNTNLIIQ